MSWGISPWGTGSWGGLGPLYIVSARALTTHSVEVTLSEMPRNESPIGEGDALNPQTWTLNTSLVNYTVLASRKITNTKYEIVTLQPFKDYRVTHTVGSITLLRPDGVTSIAPYDTDFPGVVVASEMLRAPKGPYDLLNVPSTMADGSGALVVGSTGNYTQQFGDDMLLKLAVRRLTTTPGSYFHIAENEYGIGLKGKEPLRSTSLLNLKVQIEQEMQREPGIVGATAGLSFDPVQGLLKINLKLRTEEGTERSLDLEMRQ